MSPININHANLARGIVCFMLLLYPAWASAAPEEIQVYLEEFAEPGQVGLDLHTIYVASIQNNANQLPLHQLRLTPELSYGLNDHFETAAYFLTNWVAHGNPQTDGFKVRMRWRPIVPTAAATWYAAVNVELGQLAKRFNRDGSNGELKGILTWKSPSWIAGLNLNLDRPLRLHTAAPTTAEIDAKLAYKLNDHWQLGIEKYSFLGPLHSRVAGMNPSHSRFLTADFSIAKWDLNVGVGQARGDVPDKLIVKAIIGIPI